MALIPADAASDRDLLAQWQEGDGEAYAELVRRHGGLVHRACQRQLGAADADDAAQAVFLVLLGKPRQALKAPVLEAWLLAVARRVCANAARTLRRRARREESIVADLPQPSLPPPAALPLELLDAALADLPAHERAAIIRHYLGGVSQADIARADGCPEATIRARVHRGLERLRGWFRRRGQGATLAVLAAVLTAEGQAAEAVPVPNPMTGAGARAPSADAHAWSHTTMRQMTMSRILPPAAALSAVALAGACWLLPAAEPKAAPAPAHGAPSPATAVVEPTAPAELASLASMLGQLPDGCEQVLIVNLPDLRVVLAQYGKPELSLAIIASRDPALGRAALTAKAERGEAFVPTDLFPLMPGDTTWSHHIEVKAADGEDPTVTTSSKHDPSFSPRWTMVGGDVALSAPDEGAVVMRWLPDGCLKVAAAATIDRPARVGPPPPVMMLLGEQPEDAWLRLATTAVVGTPGSMDFWLRPASAGGSYEFHQRGLLAQAGPGGASGMVAGMQGMIDGLAKRGVDGVQAAMRPYIDRDPRFTAQRQALVDGFIACAETALASARVTAEQGDLVIRGTTDAAALESNLPVLLSGIQ